MQKSVVGNPKNDAETDRRFEASATKSKNLSQIETVNQNMCLLYMMFTVFVLSIKGERNKKLNTTIISNKRVMPKEDLT